MALFTDAFTGANNTTFTGRTGWSLTPGFYDVLKLDGAGAVKSDSYTDDPKSIIHDTGSLNHYVEIVVGSAFVSTTAFGKINLGASQTGRSAKFSVSYNGSTGQLRILGQRDGSNQTVSVVTATLAAGDTLRIEQNDTALTLVVKVNGTAVHTESNTSFFNETPSTGVGLILDFNGNTALTDIIRNFESNAIGGAAAPVLTLPTLVATTSTALTAGFTSDQAGKNWTVLTPAAQSAPLEAQIRAGLDATGAAAVSSVLNRTMTSGVNTFGLTGAPSTAYKQHTISEDLSGTPLVSNIVSSATETTPAAATPPVVSVGTQLIAGQSVQFSGTYSGGTPSSATASIPAAATPNGATSVGPLAVTFGAGSWTITFTGLTPGDYAAPTITMSNGAGSDTESGSAFTVMEINGNPQAPNPGETIESGAAADTQASSVLTGTVVATVEAGAAADQRAAVASASRSVAETGVAADVTQRTVASANIMAETAAPAETMAGSPTLTRTQAESGAAADAQAVTTTASRAVAETATPADAQDGVTALGNIEVQDSVVAAETQNRQASATRATTEVATAAEAMGVTLGTSRSMEESLAPVDTLGGLTVMGVVTLDALASLADTQNGVVGTIQGDIGELLVLTEQQFQSVVVSGGVLEVVVVDDTTTSTPIITPTTVVDQISVADLVRRLTYPRPPTAGATQTRRFIVYYK